MNTIEPTQRNNSKPKKVNINTNVNNNDINITVNNSDGENDLEEIKEENEKYYKERNNNLNLNKKSLQSSRQNSNSRIINVNNNSYGTLGAIGSSRVESYLEEDEDFDQYDDIVIPAVKKKKLKPAQSIEEIDRENDERFKKKQLRNL